MPEGTKPNLDQFLSLKKTMEYLGVSRRTIYRYVEEGKLKKYHRVISDTPLFNQTEVEALMQIKPSDNHSQFEQFVELEDDQSNPTQSPQNATELLAEVIRLKAIEAKLGQVEAALKLLANQEAALTYEEDGGNGSGQLAVRFLIENPEKERIDQQHIFVNTPPHSQHVDMLIEAAQRMETRLASVAARTKANK